MDLLWLEREEDAFVLERAAVELARTTPPDSSGCDYLRSGLPRPQAASAQSFGIESMPVRANRSLSRSGQVRTAGTDFGNGERPAALLRAAGEGDRRRQEQWRFEFDLRGECVR